MALTRLSSRRSGSEPTSDVRTSPLYVTDVASTMEHLHEILVDQHDIATDAADAARAVEKIPDKFVGYVGHRRNMAKAVAHDVD